MTEGVDPLDVLITEADTNKMISKGLPADRIALENAIVNGHCVIIENLGEEIDATLDPVLSRAIYKKGRALFLKLGGEEVEYDPGFTLYLQTKLANPHYK